MPFIDSLRLPGVSLGHHLPLGSRLFDLLLCFPFSRGVALCLGLLVSGVGCITEESLPDPGACAGDPSVRYYDWGEIPIGTCLAGPSDLQVWPDPADPSRYQVVVVNSNFEANFTSGSVLVIPGEGIDLSKETNYMHEVGASALPLPRFPARIARDLERNTAFVSVRSAAGIDGNLTDRVFALDASDPMNLTWSDAAPEQDEDGSFIYVPADPYALEVDEETGYLYVLNLTTHDVAVVDVLADPYTLVDVAGEAELSDALFVDADTSGSVADFELALFQTEYANTDDWTLTYNEGTYRLYYPARDGSADGLFHADSADGWSFTDAQGGPDLAFTDDDSIYGAGYGAAAVILLEDGLHLYVGAADGETGVSSIVTSLTSESATSWGEVTQVLASGTAGYFDEAGVSDPAILVLSTGIQLYYRGVNNEGVSAIGLATSEDGTTFGRQVFDDREPGLILSAGEEGSWDESGVSSPSGLYLAETESYYLYYDSPDSAEGGIGLARGGDVDEYIREELEDGAAGRVLGRGEAGSWDGGWVGSPTVIVDRGLFHMWYAGTDGATWGVGHATSAEGLHWEKDPHNPVFIGRDGGYRMVAPAAYKASAGGYFRVEGEVAGLLPETAIPSIGYSYAASPFLFTVVDRFALGFGPEGEFDEAGAASPHARVEESGQVHLLYEGRADAHRLGEAFSTGGVALSDRREISLGDWEGELAGSEDLDDPAFGDEVEVGTLFFAAAVAEQARIFRAREDGAGGYSEENSAVLAESGVEGTWDSLSVRSPMPVMGPDSPLLFYEGSDGEDVGIGLAVGDGTGAFQRVTSGILDPLQPGRVLAPGEAGEWDDGGVRGPSVWWDPQGGSEGNGLFHLWYAGSDGQKYRIGHATSENGLTWTRHADEDGLLVPVLEPSEPSFDEDGCLDPSVVFDEERGLFRMWYQGTRGGISRIGYAESEDGDHWLKVAPPTTAGDRFELATQRGDDSDTSTIFLGDERTGIIIDGETVRGSGVSDMILSPDGRFAYVANKKYDNIYVLDIHDDSTADTLDANYLGVEAVIRTRLDEPVVGTRGLAFSPDGTRLYALLSPLVVIEDTSGARTFGPEGVLIIDLSGVVDGSDPYTLDDAVIGWLPSERGVETDQGARSAVNVGPANIVLTADGTRAYVAHFNANLIQVYDLTKGAYGKPIAVAEGLGEEPFDLALSPDEKILYVANYTGELSGYESNVVHSTVQVIDVDEESPTWLQVLTTLRNRDAF